MALKRVLAIGKPKFALAELAELEAKYEIDYVIPTNRFETFAAVHLACATRPTNYDWCFWLFGYTHYKPFDRELLEPVLPCGLYAGGGAGYDSVDVEWITSAGAYYTSTPGTPTIGTADMHVFLILAAEKVASEDRWRDGLPLYDDPEGKILGIIGMGDIERDVAGKMKAFDMKIIYNNRQRLPTDVEELLDAEYVSLEQLLRRCDVLSINCPLTKETYHLISTEEFDMMKNGVYVVNTARGAIIDEQAFKDASISGKVFRAGLDVFETKPHIDPFFRKCDRVTIQPHYGGFQSEQSMKERSWF
ncbi:glycerate-and formate-dehydrogenase [Lipomyces arxii]|uniref:glycerate-and formate-dehydrogenase n=1 Tax=Lipomyces arxii TaxID=56418 RepID=UPI0034CD89BC